MALSLLNNNIGRKSTKSTLNDIDITKYRKDHAERGSQIEKFKSMFKGGLRPNKYQVEFGGKIGIGTPDIWEKMSMLCKGLAYSFYTYDKVEVFQNNTTMESVNKINFEPIILRWYVDTKGDILKTLQQWKELQYDDVTGMFGFRNDYTDDIEVTLLGEDYTGITSVTYHNAFPIVVDDIELGYEASDTIMEVNVTFAYDFPNYNF